MQNIAKAGIGDALPFSLHAASYTLPFIEYAFRPQQLYPPFHSVTDQSSGFSRFKKPST